MAENNILIVAFQFPPMSGSSGLLRATKFCCYLPEAGWTPTVLTAHPRAYDQVNEEQLGLLPKDLRVIRAFALDATRHLSIRGRYLRAMALPDRWVSWLIGAIPAGLREIRKSKTDVIFSTFPIATAVWAGLALHRLSGKPWVVDFRDSMTEEHYPRDPLTWRFWRWLEQQAVKHASLLLFTAPSAVKMYRERYPELAAEKCLLLPNGYDEEDFAKVGSATGRNRNGPIRLLHSGLVYPEERDPRPFFQAVARLQRDGKVSREDLRIDFRASGFEEQYGEQLRNLNIEGLVRLLPRIPYRQALEEYADCDAFLLMQAQNCDHQIPAKAYEYLRMSKPILGLTTESGDTGALLRQCGGATIVDLADEEAIYERLPRFLEEVRTGRHAAPSREMADRYSRRSLAHELARHLNVLKRQARQAKARSTHRWLKESKH